MAVSERAVAAGSPGSTFVSCLGCTWAVLLGGGSALSLPMGAAL